MWKPRQAHHLHPDEEDDDSWEVKAFEQDIKGNIMGTTWPPTSYTCGFCRREFRSAQALGGHMNVHRRDRAARLHGQPGACGGSVPIHVPNSPSSSSIPSSSTLVVQSDSNKVDGICHLYQLPNNYNPSGIFNNTTDMSVCRTIHSTTSTLAPSISPYHNIPNCNFNFQPSNFSFGMNSLHFYPGGAMNPLSSKVNRHDNTSVHLDNHDNLKEPAMTEELDLELRLGHKKVSPP